VTRRDEIFFISRGTYNTKAWMNVETEIQAFFFNLNIIIL
jgi:hypothetical protein